MIKKILFISHDASRTGAPIVLLHLLKWIKTNTDIEITVLMINGGELENSFSSVANKTFVWNKYIPPSPHESIYEIFRKRLLYKLFGYQKVQPSYQEYVLSELKLKQFNLIYANTVASLPLLPILKEHINVPVISHVHEMPFSIRAYFPNSFDVQYTSLIDKYICVSNLAATVVTEFFGLPKESVNVVNEFIDIATTIQSTVNSEVIREELGIQDNFVVGGSGTMGWRKGVDLFINLSRLIQKKKPGYSIKFVWVGNVNREVVEGYMYESKLLKELTNIIFTGVKDDPQNYFQVFDVFALTSREDPFPLVCIEAAALQKPIVCFENGSGIPEMLVNGGGVIVPYIDIDAMAETIIKLYEDHDMIKIMGEKAHQQSKRYDVSVIAPTIVQLMEDLCQKNI